MVKRNKLQATKLQNLIMLLKIKVLIWGFCNDVLEAVPFLGIGELGGGLVRQ